MMKLLFNSVVQKFATEKNTKIQRLKRAIMIKMLMFNSPIIIKEKQIRGSQKLEIWDQLMKKGCKKEKRRCQLLIAMMSLLSTSICIRTNPPKRLKFYKTLNPLLPNGGRSAHPILFPLQKRNYHLK